MPEPIDIEFVNREDIIQRLREIRAGSRPARILLIKGAEGMGKSWLLRRAQHEHQGLPSALIDLTLQYGQDPIELARGLRERITGVDWSAVDKVLAEADASYVVSFQGHEQKKLLELISRHFSVDELRTLCFNLQIDFEELGGDGKTGIARELILHMSRRRGGMTILVDEIRRERSESVSDDVKLTDIGDTISLSGADHKLAKESLPRRLAESLVAALYSFTSEQPALILLDAYEKGTPTVWAWLLQHFLPPIRKGVLTGVVAVIAGREIPLFDREWRIIVDATELTGLPLSAIHEYWVTRRAQPQTALEFAIKYSGGIPLMLAQMADIADLSSEKSLRA